ncbi:MAG: glycosyltransferase family 4 protein [Fervidobacterium sp.]
MKEKKIGLILAGFPLLERKGGPPTYLFNLKKGVQQANIDDIFVESVVSSEDYYKGLNVENSYSFAHKIKRSLKQIAKKTLLEFFPRQYSKIVFDKSSKTFKINGERFLELFEKFDENYKVSFIHFHRTVDLYTWFISAKNTIPLILTSHSPYAPHIEIAEDVKYQVEKFTSKSSVINTVLENIKNNFEKIDEIAFEKADYLIFPCEESMESYSKTWNQFDEIVARKKVIFIPTGSLPLLYSIDRDSFREKYNIPKDAFVVSYVGRHIAVKGYDLLCESAEYVWKRNKNVYFLIAGKQEPLKGLKDDRWIEIGWTNDPGSVINASDVFVLPNRDTFFDLVLIEFMSLAKPALVSHVGGNKFLARQSEGIIPFSELTARALADKILELSTYEKEVLERLGKANYDLYNSFYTADAFAKRYREKVGKIFFHEDKM